MSKGLKIAVNTRLLLPDKMEGIGYFAYETLLRITRQHPETEFHFLFDRPYDKRFIFADNVKPVVLFPPARHPFLWYWWFEWTVAGYLRRNKCDLFLSPDGYCSLRSSTPTLAVQHDLAFEHYPAFVPALHSKYYKYFVPRFMAHATRIATVSAYSKADIVRLYGTKPDKIDVVYNAAKDVFAPINKEEIKVLQQQHTQGKSYFIYVGSIHPRKNLKNMLLAYDKYRSARPAAEQKFLIAGAPGWQNSELWQVVESLRYRNDVIFLGRQPLDGIAKLVAGAYAMLYVSLFEGFGVPPIEAMQCGVPVITSSTSSMPEICGDAALFAHPLNVQQIAEAMISLYDNSALNTELSTRGIIQAKKYSWDLSAQLLWQSCLKTLGKI